MITAISSQLLGLGLCGSRVLVSALLTPRHSSFSHSLQPAGQSGQQQHQACSSSSTAGSPSDEETVTQIRARIFGAPIVKGERTGRRALAKRLTGAELASWYFLPQEAPGFHDEEAEE